MRPGIMILALTLALDAAHGAGPGLRVPDGFEVSEFSDHTLANDITCLTLDQDGNIIVSGRGYIRRLVDTDGDGSADRADTLATLRDAAHGLLCESDVLYFVADGALSRLWLRANRPVERLYKLKTGGEHDAHAVRRGPDGWLYLLCGNSTGIDAHFVSSTRSPIMTPVAGVVVRFSPDFTQREIVADGFRNPYDLAFSPDGALFTFDSDNERCVSLPWYEHTRCYHVVPGGHYGWLNPQHAAFWRMPPYFADVVAPVCTLERGSPTGVAWQAHPALPAAYHGLYLADWTFGRIWHVQPEPYGSTFRGQPSRFLEATGSNGFAPTALAVHAKTGALFVAIGGRGTRGAVYRIRWTGPTAKAAPAPPLVRRRRLEWNDSYRAEILRATERNQPELVTYHALVDLLRHREHFTTAEIVAVIRANWERGDRIFRQVLARMWAALPLAEQEASRSAAQSVREKLIVGFGQAATASTKLGALAHDIALEVLRPQVNTLGQPRSKEPEPTVTLDALRLWQIGLGDVTARNSIGHVWEGYTRRQPSPLASQTATALAARLIFRSGHGEIDRELGRILALNAADDADVRRRLTLQWTDRSDPVDDIHYLIVYSRLPGMRLPTETAACAAALLKLDAKLTARRMTRDRNWPLRIAELHAELAKRDPNLNTALLADRSFGRPSHAMFTRAPGFDRTSAARRFVERSKVTSDSVWTAESMQLLAALPTAEAVPLARTLWGKGGLDDALVPILARAPERQDTARFLVGLSSVNVASVRKAVEALDKLGVSGTTDQLVELIRSLRRLPTGKETDPVRARIGQLLDKTTGQRFGVSAAAWIEWLVRTRPEVGKKFTNIDGVDFALWQVRLAKIDWATGQSTRGKAVFAKASCLACHSGGQALGPDLAGAGKRFARAELFAAIVQPNRDVSDRYRTTQIETSSGHTVVGLVIYEAVDGVLIQTSAAETVRIDGRMIESRRQLSISLMPAGLLDTLSDQELADLYAYLLEMGNSR